MSSQPVVCIPTHNIGKCVQRMYEKSWSQRSEDVFRRLLMCCCKTIIQCYMWKKIQCKFMEMFLGLKQYSLLTQAGLSQVTKYYTT